MDECDMPPAESTRRKFIKKARYVVPAMWVLAAAPEQAFASAPASGTCLVSGQACVQDGDCCSLDCNPGMMCEEQ